MNPLVLLEKFKSGEFNPDFGHDPKSLDDYQSPEEVAEAFRQQKPVTGYQLISRVLYLLGVNKETATLASTALNQFARGQPIPDLTPLIGKPIGLISVSCGHHGVYQGLFSPVPVITLDQGQTWLSFDGRDIEAYSLKTWMSRRFHELLSLMPLSPRPDHFNHDFRRWALFEPTAAGFMIKSGTHQIVGNRSRDQLIELVTGLTRSLDEAEHVQPIISPPFIIPGQQIIPKTAESIVQEAIRQMSGPAAHTRSRDTQTGEPAQKKARLE